MTHLPLDDQVALQKRIISFLAEFIDQWDSPESVPAQIEIVETHGATVLLGQIVALKLKKPVHFDHMNYSTADRRKQLCQKEFSRGKINAPDLYVQVRPIYLKADDSLSLKVDGDIIDWLLEMRRFDKGAQLDEIAATKDFTPVLIDGLTDAVLAFHKQANIIQDPTSVPDFHDVIDANFLQLDEFSPAPLNLQDVQAYRQDLHDVVNRFSTLISKRLEDGWVRWGHGDLHLQNICLLDEKPLLFDAIEYEDAFVISDILYDLSFLIMDLWEKDYPLAANKIFNRYLNGIGWTAQPTDLDGLQLLPFYLSMRAGIRTHVQGRRFLQSTNTDEKNRFKTTTSKLFSLARAFLAPPAPRLVAVGGYSGSGKSTLAASIAPHLGAAPGAIHIRSDVIRRQLIGWDEFSPMPQSAYTSQKSQHVYDKMMQIAASALRNGQSVIMDAVLDRKEDQLAFERVADTQKCAFMGLWLNVSESIMKFRIENRKRDASDATAEILQMQISRSHAQNENWLPVDGNGSPDQVLANSLNILGLSRL